MEAVQQLYVANIFQQQLITKYLLKKLTDGRNKDATEVSRFIYLILNSKEMKST